MKRRLHPLRPSENGILFSDGLSDGDTQSNVYLSDAVMLLGVP